MKQNIYKLLLLSVLSSFMTMGQGTLPNTITRSAQLNLPPTKRDSTVRSITLNPGFKATPTATNYYETVLMPLYIEWPKPGQIIQRDNNNKAWLYIKGTCIDPSIAQVEARAVPIQGGSARTKIWNLSNQTYEGALELTGGDYRIEVREIKSYVGANPVYGRLQSVQRVGVGEVLMIWGHSFAGGSGYSDAANDPRVRTVVTVRNPAIPHEPGRLQDFSILPFQYQQITQNDLGPYAVNSWIWAALGDTLARRLNVPIFIYSAAFGGSTVLQNKRNIDNQPFGYDWFGYLDQFRLPYRPVEATFQKYVPYSGIRAVLCQHGVNDRGAPYGDPDNFYNDLLYVITHTRNVQAQHPQLAYVIGREGNFMLETNTTAINNHLINFQNNVPNVISGIDFGLTSTVGPWRDQNGYGHFLGNAAGHHKYLELWKNAISNSLFTITTPKMATVANALKVP